MKRGTTMLFRTLKESFQSIGKTLDKPTFIKDFENSDELIGLLEQMKLKTTDMKIIEAIELDQLLIKQGNIGEQNVHYEIKNSFIPMYALHDIVIEYEEYRAQLDFVLITSRFILILETKKLVGDIQINNQGEFIRTIKNRNGRFIKKEGMYSPISQNARHVRIVREMLIKEKMIKNLPVLSLVVIANPKSIIDFKYAPKELKDQIIKYDQLTVYLKKKMVNMAVVDLSIVTMQNIAEFLIKNHVEKENSFVVKYRKMLETNTGDVLPEKVTLPGIEVKVEIWSEQQAPPIAAPVMIKQVSTPTKNGNGIDQIRDGLIAFRKQQSKTENVAAYYIFNNVQMEDILTKLPGDKAALLGCSGFGPVKVEKYGGEILRIVNGEC